MSDFRFIHCADLHLGSRFAGIRSRDGELAERMTESTFSSFSGITDLARSENADFMVISGDIFDKETITPRTRFRFAEILGRLDIPCFIAWGNHDHTTSWEEGVPLPANVREFGGEPERFMLELRNGGAVEISGISFTSKNTSEDLAAKLEGGKDVFTVGCVHCDVDSGDASAYAPARLVDMIDKDIDYWALGHIHRRAVLHERPYVVYPGNTQGRNIKESGEKGAYVVTVASDTVEELRFVPTQKIVWEKIEADITGHSLGSFIDSVSSKIKKDSVVRIAVKGRGALDNMIRSEPDDILKAIQSRSAGTVADLEVCSKPERMPSAGGNDLVSKVASVADSAMGMERGRLIDIICDTATSKKHLRKYFESMSDEDLGNLVGDAKVRLLERFSEASE
jgi:DNA repair exonuclease SbcCD nuclease subunit